MVAVPLIDTEIGHYPVIGFSLPRSFEFPDIRVADMTVVPAAFAGGYNLGAGLPNVSVLGGNTLVEVYVINYLERIPVFAQKSVDNSILIDDETRRIIVVTGAAAEFVAYFRDGKTVVRLWCAG